MIKKTKITSCQPLLRKEFTKDQVVVTKGELFRMVAPYPVSVNSWIRTVGRRVYKTEKAKQYTKDFNALLYSQLQQTLTEPLFSGDQKLAITVKAYPPDRRRRDLDNLGKVLFDTLQTCKIIEDDSQFHCIIMYKQPVDNQYPKGAVNIEIVPFTNEEVQHG